MVIKKRYQDETVMCSLDERQGINKKKNGFGHLSARCYTQLK